MVCIYCESPTQITNSRLQKRANQIWRRRQCLECGNTFTTHELVDLGASVAVRRSQSELRPFSRDLLFISVYESCKHRATATEDAAALVRTILSLLRPQLVDGVISREQIVEIVRAVLGRFDLAAATMYKAYHPL